MPAMKAQEQTQAKKPDVSSSVANSGAVTNASTKSSDKASQDSRDFLPMQKGCKKSQYVFELQAMLMQDGDYASGTEKSSGYLDGDFGSGTEGAVINFQKKNGIKATGIVDAETWDTLKANVDLYENSAKEGLSGKSNAEFGTAQNKLGEYASFYDGYLEKNDASDLNNAGVGGKENFTRFGRDYCIATQTGSGFVATYWCNMFVDGVMSEAYGVDNAKKMMNGMSALCSQTAQNMSSLQSTKDDPGEKRTVTSHDGGNVDRKCTLFVEAKAGDFVFFWNGKGTRISHIGIVKSVDGADLTTVEGNASVKSDTNNGGGVCTKVYKNYRSMERIAGFGRPDWSVVEGQFGVEGSAVSDAQKAEQAMNSDTKKDEVMPEVDSSVKAAAGKDDAKDVKAEAENSGKASPKEEKAWLHANLTPTKIQNAINFNNNTDHVGMSERPAIRELVGCPRSKDSFSSEDIQSIADWQLNNGLDVDGKFGGDSLTMSAYIDYSKYLEENGGEAKVDDSRAGELESIMAKIDSKYEVIDKIGQLADVPPAMVAAIWSREASLRDGVYLHNGQELGKPTDLVPKGICFRKDQFVEAAVHALQTHKAGPIKLLGLGYNSTDVAAMCAYTESYNGWGYRKYHNEQASAYVTSGTTKYSGGKYVADGKYDSTAQDKQMGTLPIMSEILKRHPVKGAAGGGAVTAVAAPKTDGHVAETEAAKVQVPAADKVSEQKTQNNNPHNIDINGAISYNNDRNCDIVSKLQSYVCAEATGKFDAQTVLKIADWQASTNGALVVDGKFGKNSYKYAVAHNFDADNSQSAGNEAKSSQGKGASSAPLAEGNITEHFKWSEFACHDAAHTPVPEEYRDATKNLCKNLEVLRAALGGAAITINSGYRTPAHNGNTPGAASKSRHMYADAADIRVAGYTAAQVHAKITELIHNGEMEEGGLGSYSTWTHYDVRGYKARWNE